MNKINLVIILVITITVNSNAQNFEVPENYKIETSEDCLLYESNIIDAVDWIIDTPITGNNQKRKDTYKFIMNWLSASSDFTVYLSSDIAPFISNPDLRMVFLGGITKYLIETKDYKNELGKNIAGINTAIAFYGKNKEELGNIESIEKYIELKNTEKLEDYLKLKLHIH